MITSHLRRAACVAGLAALPLLLLPGCGGKAEVPAAQLRLANMPEQISQSAGEWGFVAPGGPNAPVLLQLWKPGGEPRTVRQAAAIGCWHGSADRVVWSERRGTAWAVCSSARSGGPVTDVAQLPEEPSGAYVDGSTAYWLAPQAPPSSTHAQLAPLMSCLGLYCSKGPTPAVLLGSVPEMGKGRVLGVRDGKVVVVAWRVGPPGSLVAYEIPAAGGVARRVGSTSGAGDAILGADGVLYWVAQGRETSQDTSVVSLGSLDKDGRVTPLSDWLDGGGKLYNTRRGVLYLDAETEPGIWPLGREHETPHALAVSSGYRMLALGQEEALVHLNHATGKDRQFGLVRLP